MPQQFTNAELDKMFEPKENLVERWGITDDEAEVFLENVGYYNWHEL